MADTLTFATLLKRHRQQHGFTQDHLAERTGCATQTIRKLEGGHRRPSYQMAERLAQVLHIPPDQHETWMQAARETPEQEAVQITPLEPRQRLEPHNMPAYLAPLIGREQEQAKLAHLVHSPGCRLVSLLGPGGIGKTRLAVEIARQPEGFSDGVAFVPLASVTSPQAIVPALGDGLGFTFAGTNDLDAQLMSYLRDKHALLVLDNMEHLLDEHGYTLNLIEQMLSQAPQITLLVTSRERLKLAGEWVVEIEGLAVPPAGAVSKHRDYPALKLFVEHAQRVQHGFQLRAENEQAVAKICRLVGGMPLGIELAAAWTRLLSPEEIGQELERNLDAQHLSPGGLPTRHHSLRSVVDHSWRLLSEAERHVLSRLSIFQGGFTRQAAAEVAEASLPILASLADKSLLRRGANGRYDLHEVIRQYAGARLHENPADYTLTQEQHAIYYTRLLAEREQQLKGAQQAKAVAELSADFDNIRTGWYSAANRQWFDVLERAGETLQWFCEFRSWYQEGVSLFLHATKQLRMASPTGEARDQTLGRMLGYHGYLAARIGLFEQARNSLDESHALLRSGRDPFGLSRTCVHSGIVAFYLGDYTGAREMIGESLALAESLSDRWEISLCQTWMSLVMYALGEYAESERLFRAGLAGWRELGNPRAIVWCTTYCSITLMALGKYQEAETLLRESVMLSHMTDDRYGMAMSLHHLGRVALKQQEYAEATYLLREALVLQRAVGSWEIAQTLNNLGMALWNTGARSESEKIYREALTTALGMHAIPDALQALAGLAVKLYHEGHYREALTLTARILSDPAPRIETREHAIALRADLLARMPSEQAAWIEQESRKLPLAEFANDLGMPRAILPLLQAA